MLASISTNFYNLHSIFPIKYNKNVGKKEKPQLNITSDVKPQILDIGSFLICFSTQDLMQYLMFIMLTAISMILCWSTSKTQNKS
jgi:hypothetical protein